MEGELGRGLGIWSLLSDWHLSSAEPGHLQLLSVQPIQMYVAGLPTVTNLKMPETCLTQPVHFLWPIAQNPCA